MTNCIVSSPRLQQQEPFILDPAGLIVLHVAHSFMKASDNRAFGFVTFRDPVAAQQFVQLSPHCVPDATTEIIAKWRHGRLEVNSSAVSGELSLSFRFREILEIQGRRRALRRL